MADFGQGEKIALSGGAYAEVIRKLGEGGQGSVYEVAVNGKSYALKWYHPGKLKNPVEFRKNIQENITNGAPSAKFLWPLYLTEEKAGTFGYIMGLRPGEYTDFPAILNAKDKNGNRV
ncbi:MAG: hypothetical protein LBT68_07175, partial [Spirochaetales bacterium]|nr:hypothetical protein [Spirochaetales bacterium]